MYLSHTKPDKRLVVHLREVYEYLKTLLEYVPLSREDYETVQYIGKIVAVTHDFGKYLSYFQTYLRTKETEGDLHHHSFISAVFAAHLLCRSKSLPASWSEFAPLLGYFAVMHHHGNLRDIALDVTDSNDIYEDDVQRSLYDRVRTLKIQLEDIKKHASSIIEDLSPLWEELQIPLFLSEELANFIQHYENAFDETYRQFYLLTRRKRGALTAKLYYYALLLYSVLIDADKWSAANIKRNSRVHIPGHLVDQYRQANFDVEILEGTNGWRNRMYGTVMERIEQIARTNAEQRLFTLTAPTGAGKTLLSISVALKWREHAQKYEGYTPKIIYALPFTSVIDQNEKVIYDLLAQLEDFKGNEQRYLVKHHHLSTFQYRTDHQELPLRQALLLTESWEAEFIITTFVQLFQTLIGYENRALKKFHQIAGSILILDEIQNVPVEYWPLLRVVLSNMAELFSCKILLLTATQPLIFPQGETIELLESESVQPIHFFQEMERVHLQWLKGSKGTYNVDEWMEQFQLHFEDGKTYLAIFNTIKTSIDVYERLKKWLKQHGYHVFYLSTNIVPCERKQRIEAINDLLKEKQKVAVISTQVVEAGVDVDFDVVYRDLGPIDSIVQAAGRCNRNGQKDRLGKVYITPMERNGALESKYVYGAVHTNIAKELLPEESMLEHQFFDAIHQYFSNVKNAKSFTASDGIIKAMEELKFDAKDKPGIKQKPEYVSEFQLIENAHQAVDVFVEVDDRAIAIWQEYITTVIEESNLETRFENYLRLKRDIRQYVISAPIQLVKNLDRDSYEKTRMLHLSNDLLNQYYNSEYGLIRSSEMVDAWIM
ncbi:CRISPR-associated helicase Cas3' [Anoxybacillus rupiensis]|uniref:CRISPR-associated helicase Cas3 n=1 Tax=Anoxybacteroides rupiense TaxID=311460 RepID=A0ABT5W292_9BACL|nr:MULTISPECIES: CRISPR-associated helicase Cas3' [Anoxybacillus]MBS2772161.1 CRISPR-associated helicase Cas3' [Anoxybacillus rupiensis]MDE8563449.1 CRISPR-associated helicase Cas3' [Anoxybacillus rupiensis]QHC02904.1 CRISPR-associated helicase Cas3' [Anoxybacillus sp. PDR2]